MEFFMLYVAEYNFIFYSFLVELAFEILYNKMKIWAFVQIYILYRIPSTIIMCEKFKNEASVYLRNF